MNHELRVLDVDWLLLAIQRLDDFLAFAVLKLVFFVKGVDNREHVVLINVGAHGAVLAGYCLIPDTLL